MLQASHISKLMTHMSVVGHRRVPDSATHAQVRAHTQVKCKVAYHAYMPLKNDII
jgi:hypothetical protein